MTKLGRVIYIERGYTIVEVLEDLHDGRGALLGYSLFGRGSNTMDVHTKEGALEALRKLVPHEQR